MSNYEIVKHKDLRGKYADKAKVIVTSSMEPNNITDPALGSKDYDRASEGELLYNTYDNDMSPLFITNAVGTWDLKDFNIDISDPGINYKPMEIERTVTVSNNNNNFLYQVVFEDIYCPLTKVVIEKSTKQHGYSMSTGVDFIYKNPRELFSTFFDVNLGAETVMSGPINGGDRGNWSIEAITSREQLGYNKMANIDTPMDFSYEVLPPGFVNGTLLGQPNKYHIEYKLNIK